MRATAAHLVARLHLRVGVRRDLREVADAEDLMLSRERPERATDDLAEPPAHAGVEHVAERAVRRGRGVARAIVSAIGIEEIALHGGTRESELLALSVDRDQLAAALGELRERNGLAVHARRRASRLDLTTEDELIVARTGEHGLDLGSVRTFAHHACRNAAAGRGGQRVHERRLAGAGFPGEDREAGASSRRSSETRARSFTESSAMCGLLMR
ncbi:MAG TPA: hypothetical protein VGS17_01125 [Candidatus Limnocylindria bacterium]|nr:hypothetical protein [Candidatus Limnocylindria bacterium]